MISPEYFDEFNAVLKCFKLIGIDILDEENVIITKSVYVLQLAIVIFCIISHWAYLHAAITNGEDFISLSADLSFFFGTVQAFIVHPTFCYQKQHIKSCITKIGEQWCEDNKLRSDLIPVKREYSNYFSSFRQKYFKLMMPFSFFYLLSSLCQTLFAKYIMLDEDVSPVTPFHLLLPIDLDKHFVLYIVFYMCDFVTAMNINVVINLGFLLIIITMSRLRILFVLLQEDFKNVFDAGNEFNEQELKTVVRRHARLLDLVNELSKGFGNIFAVHLFFVSGTIAFFGLSARVNGVVENLRNLGASILVISILFLCCLYGQLLTDSSVDVGNKIHESAWYKLRTISGKNILIILQRSQQITYVKSVSLMEISLATFTKVMKMTWSLLSFTVTLCEDK